MSNEDVMATELETFIYDEEGNLIEDVEPTPTAEGGEIEDDYLLFDEDGNLVDEEDPEDGAVEDEDSDQDQGEDQSEEQDQDQEIETVQDESEKTDLQPEDKKEQVLVEKPQPRFQAQNDDAEFLDRIKPDYIPGSQEFFDAVERAAIESFSKEVGEEFDEYNTKHIVRMSYFARRESAKRENEYHDAIGELRQEKGAKAAEQEISSKMASILNTPELQTKFNEEFEKISVSKYRQFERELAAGNLKGFLEFVNDVATRKPSKPVVKGKPTNTTRKNNSRTRRVELFSDYLI